jgi:hypothetical protein
VSGRPRWPVAAICLYAALVPLQPVLVLPDGSPLRIAAADLVAPVVYLAALAHPRRRLPFVLAAAALAIPGVAVLATLASANFRPMSMYALGKTAGLLYLTTLALAVVRAAGRDAAPAVLRALARGAFWSAVVGLVAFAAWRPGTPSALVPHGRLSSTMTGDPNIYASLLAVGLLATLAERDARPGGRLGRGAVLVAALLATGSRSGGLAVLAGLAVAAVVRRRDTLVTTARGLYWAGAVAIGAASVVATESGSSGLGRLWAHHWRAVTVENRLELYGRALGQFADHPVTGLGIGGFRELNRFAHGGSAGHFVVHNTYLWALVDLGLAGGLLVVALLIGATARSVRAARGHPPVEGAAIVAAGLVAMAVFNLFVDGFYQRHFWLLVACALGMPILRRRPSAATRGQPVPVAAVGAGP